MFTFCDNEANLKNLDPAQAEQYAHDPNSENHFTSLCGRKSVWDVLRQHPDFHESEYWTFPPDNPFQSSTYLLYSIVLLTRKPDNLGN